MHGDLRLRALYSAADAMVIPSRQDNLSNTGGLPDIVLHQRTGYLAKAFDTEDLAHGIAWVPAQRQTGELGKQARERAEARFAAPVVAEQYRAVYEIDES